MRGQAKEKAIEVDSLVWDVSSFPRKGEGGMSFTEDPPRNNGINGDKSNRRCVVPRLSFTGLFSQSGYK